ncbi:glycosyltransferase family 2 protein [Endomicrobium proavitum]|uniref:Glycosyl transferase family protein n=1 Tax=Endomicrobium proavitum TaxID=1408281 RepID=A0A0G3WIK0_9BACT|nr:glycosyltransferase family 2 protein [Endomicrobium proavitum]AKL97707.1 Glycosyl transferase family protein [Endomicrobium proavitum]
MSISVVIPAYKEEENLKTLLPQIKKYLTLAGITHEIIAVGPLTDNDNSKQVCQNSGCIYVNRENGDTYGDAVRTGIKAAKNEYLLMMDADGSHAPKDILHLYAAITTPPRHAYDLVIASRYVKNGQTQNLFILKFMSYILNITYRVAFKINAKDISNSFRIYDAVKLKSLKLTCSNFDIVEEIIILLVDKFNAKIKEIPTTFHKRINGASKRNLIKFIFSYIFTMFKLYKIKIQNRKNGTKK